VAVSYVSPDSGYLYLSKAGVDLSMRSASIPVVSTWMADTKEHDAENEQALTADETVDEHEKARKRGLS